MRFENVKEEIRRIAIIEDPQKCQSEVRELDYILHEKPKIKKITRKNYYDFYEVKGYDERGHEILGPHLGSIPGEIYKNNEKQIEKSRVKGALEELQLFFKN